MTSSHPNELIHDFPASLDALDSIRAKADATLQSAGLSPAESMKICLALEEAASNIIRHAYRDWPGNFTLRIVASTSRVTLVLRDYGRAHLMEKTEPVSLEHLVATARKGGLGQLMIQKLMDDVEYITGDGYNELRMSKVISKRWFRPRTLSGRAFSLRAKFTLATATLLTIIVAATYVMMEKRLVKGALDPLHSSMASLTQTCASLGASYILNGRSFVEFDELAYNSTVRRQEVLRLTFSDSLGRILADSKDIRFMRQNYVPPQVHSAIDNQPPVLVRSADQFYTMHPIEVSGRLLGNVHLIYSVESVSEEISSTRRRLLAFVGILLVGGLVGTYLLSNYFVKPIMEITAQVRRFGADATVMDTPIEGAPEFFEISKALNLLMTRIRHEGIRRVERDRLERDAVLAGEIQSALLPQSLPDTPGLEVGAFYKAASFVGGDLYDVIPVGVDKRLLVVADVAGKGIPASLIMSMLRTTIRLKSERCVSPRELLCAVEESVSQDIPRGVFITLLLALFDTATNQLQVVSAGHHPLLRYDSLSERMEPINPRGGPLGVPTTPGALFNERYEEVSLKLNPGDYLTLYTDGLIDITGSSGQRIGEQGLALQVTEFLRAAVEGVEVTPVKTLVKSIAEKMSAQRIAGDSEDDMTLLLVRVGSGATPVRAAG